MQSTSQKILMAFIMSLVIMGSTTLVDARPPSPLFYVQDNFGRCLDAAPDGTVSAYPCHGGKNQQWSLHDPYAGTQLARHQHRQLLNCAQPGNCLCLETVPSRATGAEHWVKNCRVQGYGQSLSNQLFRFDLASPGNPTWYWLAGMYGRGCLTSKVSNQKQAAVWEQLFNSCPNQPKFRWFLEMVED